MNEGQHIDSDLLARFVSGECSEAEKLAVRSWATSDAANAQELEAYIALWSEAGVNSIPELDIDAAWGKVRQRSGMDGARVVPLWGRASSYRWVAAAAMLIGVFMGVRYLLENNSTNLMATTEHLRSTLQDSSRTILSPGSSMRVTLGKERRVHLNGEAYFEVEKDIEHPFVVSSGGLSVTVLGTAFEVSAFDTSSSILVRVRHGRVQVVANTDSLILKGGEYARYNRAAHLLERMPAPPSELWGDRILQFQDAPMQQVAQELERIFRIKVLFSNTGIQNCRLTATFEDEPIDYILRVIADTYGFKLRMEESGSYLLEGDGC